jgi:hypothetical protein
LRARFDFLDLNFIAYHSAWPYQNELAALKGFKPQRTNLYAEVGSTFAAAGGDKRFGDKGGRSAVG